MRFGYEKWNIYLILPWYFFFLVLSTKHDNQLLHRTTAVGAIVALAKGKVEKRQYRGLVKHNKAVERLLWTPNVSDVIIFHEGNIPIEHQQYVQSMTPALPLKFINVSLVYQKFVDANISSCPSSPQTTAVSRGYKSMIRFWFSDFLDYLVML